MEKTNVIGPITQDDWNVLRAIKQTIGYMKKKDPKRYADGIEFEEKWQKDIKKKYIQ